MPKRIAKDEERPLWQLREQYDIEKSLANRLRNASPEERRPLYTSVYDELYQRVPHHPQLTRKADKSVQSDTVSRQMAFLESALSVNSIFMEVGPGDCRLSVEVARLVKKVYAVDVSHEITKRTLPENCELIISDGCNIPLPKNSVNVAYSNHLMEHLHPDDAIQQIRNIHDVLVDGGMYVCITPNRLNGPHDVSQYFDDVASGFHLKEYTITELTDLFRATGFKKVRAHVSLKGPFLPIPLLLIRWIETVLIQLPFSLSNRIAGWLPVKLLLAARVVGVK
jgi:SAM-dependent methyltransferase